MNIHKKFFSKIGFYYLILAIAAIIFQIIMANVIGVINYRLLNNYDFITIVSAACSYVMPLPLMIYLMDRIDSQDIRQESISITTFIKYISVAFTLMWIGNIIGLLITAAIGTLTSTDIVNPVENLINTSDIWINLLLISIIGPIFEEFFFRKLLIDRTIKYGARVSILLSAILSGLFHGNLNQFFYAFLLGGFFAYVYIKTGKLIYTIILHISVNLLGSVVSLYLVEVAQRVTATMNPLDIGIVLIYGLFVLVALLVGLSCIINYKKAKFNGEKTQITLKHPIKTMLLNYGMICFMVFCISEIIYHLI